MVDLQTTMDILYLRRTACWPHDTGCWVKCHPGYMGSPLFKSLPRFKASTLLLIFVIMNIASICDKMYSLNFHSSSDDLNHFIFWQLILEVAIGEVGMGKKKRKKKGWGLKLCNKNIRNYYTDFIYPMKLYIKQNLKHVILSFIFWADKVNTCKWRY